MHLYPADVADTKAMESAARAFVDAAGRADPSSDAGIGSPDVIATTNAPTAGRQKKGPSRVAILQRRNGALVTQGTGV